MAGKHLLSAFGLARLLPGDDDRLRRGWTVVGGLLLAAALVWCLVWVQRSSAVDPQAQMVDPAVAPPIVVASASSVAVPASPLVSLAQSSPIIRVSPSPTPRKTLPTSASAVPVPKKASPSADAAVSATYAVSSSWETGFIGGVTLTNAGSGPLSWTVTVRNNSADGVAISTAWNATLSRQGDTDTYTGGPLAAGATASFGFEATKKVAGKVTPAGCTVNQSACRVS